MNMEKCPVCGDKRYKLKYVQTLAGEERLCVWCLNWYISTRKKLIDKLIKKGLL